MYYNNNTTQNALTSSMSLIQRKKIAKKLAQSKMNHYEKKIKVDTMPGML